MTKITKKSDVDPNDLLNEAVAYLEDVEHDLVSEPKMELPELEETLEQMNKLYRRHAFDDDQRVCKGYRETINIIKAKIKALKKVK